jgi:polyisoprenoid-binding protein YceI
MILIRTLLIIGGLCLGLGACTAINVVTHRVSDDPVDISSGTYQLDPHHWSVLFDVDHFGYSRFVSRFDEVHATLEVVADAPERSHVHVVIKAASVDTNVDELDKLVTGPDMFDAARYPEIVFDSTALTRTGPTSGIMTGNLTLHGETHPVMLDVIFNGAAPNPLTGDDTLGFAATGTFDRTIWGLGAWWPAVGNDVHVVIQAEFIKPHN